MLSAFALMGTGTGFARVGGVWLRFAALGATVGTEVAGGKGTLEVRLRRLARRPEGALKTVVGVEDLEFEIIDGVEADLDGRVTAAASSVDACSDDGIGEGDGWRARPPCPARGFEAGLND